ncbi:MAG: Eukaryotic and archaeal DNA primase, large subunit [Candidatus Argoarchaeum ethanivorans]|uniref:DNA primase large subunit PriL n=1 Tax=Candidatus Argoarchaeum ethanivorans TaxID=2608793 RepID=A0A811T746_9EURY|nr:MAG: Eukaryotic and archaeal DNA primase, large subunit [Candidatus Argoarchaeum ethanivorans]
MGARDNISVTTLAIYPFLPAAASYIKIKNLNIGVTEVTTSPGFENIIQKSMADITSAIHGTLFRAQKEDITESEMQLLSYPITRMILSCVDNPHLTQRYAIAESKEASKNLKQEKTERLKIIAKALNLHPILEKKQFLYIHFAEYVQTAHSIKELKWKLTNRRLDKGSVTINNNDFIRLLEEQIKKRVLHGMPLNVSDDICTSLESCTEQIKTILSQTQQDMVYDLGKVNQEYFPPCIAYAIKTVQAGINISHSTRFALTSFLVTIGMSTDTIVELFASSPDFDAEKTRYQIEHIAGSGGTTYTPPSCATMATFGNCIGKNRLCDKISHPLNYYRRKGWLETHKHRS